MKTTKRIFAMLLCLMMVFAMSLTAYAEEETEYTITVNGTATGYTYTAYQIFSGDLANETLSNIQWGTGVDATKMIDEKDIYTVLAEKDTAFAGCTSAAAVAEKLVGNEALAKVFADVMGDYLTSGTPNEETATTVYTIPVTEAGYYLVATTDVPDGAADTSYTRYILKVVKDVEVTHKGTVASVTKVILDPTAVTTNEAYIGETVTYQLTGTVPSNIADYKEYFYQFNDTLSDGLDFTEGSVKVMIGTVDVTKYFYVSEAAGKLTIAIEDLLALNNVTAGTVAAGKDVVVTYNATLDKDAVLVDESNPNTVTLTYSNDPNNSGEGATEAPAENPDKAPTAEEPTGETPESTVYTYTTKLTLTKIDEDNAEKKLSGAEFTLTLGDKTWTGTTDADGEIVFTGLGAGTYTLTETKAPEGYNLLADSIIFTVEFDDENKTFVMADDDTSGVAATNGLLTVTVENVSGSLLPSTGGIGTTMFYVVGGMLAMAALVVLVAKRRVGVEAE